MIKLVGYLFFFLLFSAHALVPVEGILMGEAYNEIQTDPLRSIFSDKYDTSQRSENNKVKYYRATFENGQNLGESCSYLEAPVYSTSWQEKQARRSMAATLQYIGLDTTIKAIGAYAKKLDVSDSEFKRLTKNLIQNYCSKNVTVFSLRNIEKSLEHYYQNPQMNMIPSIQSSPFATELIKMSTEKTSSRSREFDLVIRNFRAFCSWGGEVEDYRLLTSFLNNKFIMSFVIKNIAGVQSQIDEKTQKVVSLPSDSSVQVVCNDLICRKEDPIVFKKKFPLSVGSTGLVTDLSKLYCHHFKYQDSPRKTIPQIKSWIKNQELEDPILETSQFISLMTGVPDLFNGVSAYVEIPLLVKSSVDERWNQWAKEVIGMFSKDLHFEESLKVKVEPKRKLAELSRNEFKINFSITLGEMDRLSTENDIDLSFDLTLSKNYLRMMRSKWNVMSKNVDIEGKKQFKKEISDYLDIQLKKKEKLFTQKVWNEDFSRLIADELMHQVIKYEGPFFDSYQDEMIKVPVKFSYGLFALGYLKYRADVASGRLKINL
jgi:hypothetical protein